MSWPQPIRVIGVGSPHGDDALAWEVVRHLREQRPDIEMHIVDGGQRLLDLLDGRGTLLLVDAVAAGTTPGTMHCLEWPDQSAQVMRPGSTHDLRLAEALRLATALGSVPPRVVVFGMEIESSAPQAGLSPPVLAALPELVRRLMEVLASASPVRASTIHPGA
jgi:hydrogenase maturation protease